MKPNQFLKLKFDKRVILFFKKRTKFWPLGFAILVTGILLMYEGCSSTPVPIDPTASSCKVSPTEFDTWFESSSGVSLNGVVKPANSITFSDNPNCDFYKWSEQMFLWLNSPAPPSYGGGGGRIFNSPAFYDVSPLDANFDRTLIPHPVGFTGNLQLRTAQVGLNGLPTIMEKSGTMFEVEPSIIGSNGKQLILNDSGRTVEIERLTIDENKKPVFTGVDGKVIVRPRPILRKELNNKFVVQKFSFNNIDVFLGSSGNVVEVDQAQSDGNILMAQTGSLVYYTLAVNDVYAYFLTGTKNGGITPTPTQFPTTQAEVDVIKAFALLSGKTFPDEEALAIEVKTAWVEAATLPNLNTYITMTFTIPTYDGPPGSPNPNTTTWTPNGQKTVLMAMVGMHVVGSAAGHPEMIWATFEHKSNCPNAQYTYNATTGSNPHTMNPDLTGGWLFCSANPDLLHMNEPHMHVDGVGNIVANTSDGFTISPSNTIRGNAWGGAFGVNPNPLKTIAASNTELISINNSVRGQLDPADVRNNYIMTSSTWTINGGGFTGNFGNPGNNTTATGIAVGTSQMASMVMETYQQSFPTSFNSFSNNCFSCHFSNTTSVSHVFFTPGHAPHGLKQLFP